MGGTELRPRRTIRVRLGTLMLVVAFVALSPAVAVLWVRLRRAMAREQAMRAELQAMRNMAERERPLARRAIYAAHVQAAAAEWNRSGAPAGAKAEGKATPEP